VVLSLYNNDNQDDECNENWQWQWSLWMQALFESLETAFKNARSYGVFLFAVFDLSGNTCGEEAWFFITKESQL